MMKPKPVRDYRSLLKRHYLFEGLEQDELDHIYELSVERRYSGGQVIFQKGEPGTSLMAVLRGRVRISVFSESGKEVILNIIDDGEFFGEIALIDGRERTADATAMGECSLLSVERRNFLPFLERHAKTAVRLLMVLCERVRQTSDLVESVAFLELPVRLARLLIKLSETYGEETSQGVYLNLALSQRDLGNLIATSRESINKQIQQWKAADILTTRQGRYTIADPRRLETIANPHD